MCASRSWKVCVADSRYAHLLLNNLLLDCLLELVRASSLLVRPCNRAGVVLLWMQYSSHNVHILLCVRVSKLLVHRAVVLTVEQLLLCRIICTQSVTVWRVCAFNWCLCYHESMRAAAN